MSWALARKRRRSTRSFYTHCFVFQHDIERGGVSYNPCHLDMSMPGTLQLWCDTQLILFTLRVIAWWSNDGLKLEWDTLADLTSMKQGSSQMPKEPSIDNIVGLSALHAVDGVLEEFSLRMADISREPSKNADRAADSKMRWNRQLLNPEQSIAPSQAKVAALFTCA
eukprot:1161057-Pelagomonas_calceolata.AAC.3